MTPLNMMTYLQLFAGKHFPGTFGRTHRAFKFSYFIKKHSFRDSSFVATFLGVGHYNSLVGAV